MVATFWYLSNFRATFGYMVKELFLNLQHNLFMPSGVHGYSPESQLRLITSPWSLHISVLKWCLLGFALMVISEKSGSTVWLHNHFKSSTKGKHRFWWFKWVRLKIIHPIDCYRVGWNVDVSYLSLPCRFQKKFSLGTLSYW